METSTDKDDEHPIGDYLQYIHTVYQKDIMSFATDNLLRQNETIWKNTISVVTISNTHSL